MTTIVIDNPRKMPNGTVLTMGIRYTGRPDDPDARRGRTNPTVYTYALLKSGGLWYVTGSGKVPTAAGWGAVERWLSRDGRAVEWVRVALTWSKVYDGAVLLPGVTSPALESAVDTPPVAQTEADPEPENCPDHPDDPGAGQCWFESCRNCGGYHCGWSNECLDEVDTSQAHE